MEKDRKEQKKHDILKKSAPKKKASVSVKRIETVESKQEKKPRAAPKDRAQVTVAVAESASERDEDEDVEMNL